MNTQTHGTTVVWRPGRSAQHKVSNVNEQGYGYAYAYGYNYGNGYGHSFETAQNHVPKQHMTMCQNST